MNLHASVPCGLDLLAARIPDPIGAEEVSTVLMLLTWAPLVLMAIMYRRGARARASEGDE